ncbi:hypothetical protein [Devosia sp.]|uniref:hypothetical protein n=1 Tax=Devosia sp. TaxID=1871048 RepID=UPI003A942CA1
MAKKHNPRVEMLTYDVIYEDGSQRSNRRVPAQFMQGLDGGEDAVKSELARQDREISEKSGMPPLVIKSIRPSGKK